MSFPIRDESTETQLQMLANKASELTPEEVYETSLELMSTCLATNPGWTNEKLKTLPIKDVPMRCKGPRCAYASQCPYFREVAHDPEKVTELMSGLCKVDIVEIAQSFVELAKELNVDPSSHIEIRDVSNLILYQVLIRRCTWELNIHGIASEGIDAISPNSELVFKIRKPNLILKDLANLELLRGKLKNQLMASRRDKLTIQESMRKDKASYSSIFGDKKDLVEQLRHNTAPHIIDVKANKTPSTNSEDDVSTQ